MKFKAHQSFFIRKGWLSKGLKAVVDSPDGSIFMPINSKLAMDTLGLGSNQVVALRYWLVAVGLIREEQSPRKHHEVTELGRVIMENDPYFEEMGTLWALHCNLASNVEEATSWYWLFNEFKATSFSKEDFVRGIQKFVAMNDAQAEASKGRGRATSSLEADFDCILNTYIPHERLTGKRVSPENVIDCPLGDLGVLAIDNRSKKTYRKTVCSAASISSQSVMYAIAVMIESQGIEAKEVPIEQLLLGKCSPGLLLGLDSAYLLTLLYEVEDDGFIRINRTAGSDVVRVLSESSKAEYLASYYSTLQG